jgi:mannose-1-phosphate guanylyltransferase/mannose-6-phosphate isomerase
VWELGAKDVQGNVQQGDVLMSGTKGSLVYASTRLVATVGVDDMVIVETADAVLVAHRDRSQEVKAIVQNLSEQKRFEQTLHRKVHRPWGWYDSVDEGDRFKVKRICVNPGGTLSLQKHHKRAEHWIVVKGEAEVTCDDQVKRLQENESTYIPLGSVHRLSNPGNTLLELIEVQTGGYLGEDDIVRFEDTYGRPTQD